MFKQNFGVEQVKKHPYILCVCAKWIGEREVLKFSKWEHGTRAMLREVNNLLEQCDAVVTKNGTKFDLPWLRTELARMRMPPFPPLTHIDLEKVARGYFRFHSNKLDYIGQYLEEGEKVHHEGFRLWREVMEGDEKARAKMLKYCAGDITLTERIYHRLRPFIENHPAIRAFGSVACPKCGSKKTQKRGVRYTACFEIQRHQCKDCRGWFSGARKKVA
jgi:uncharacterized protein YprB with RNaseH-like and TPR domain